MAILRAAAEVFRAEGYDSATLDTIAKRLGISRAAVLYYFPTKQDLLRQVVAPYMDELDRLLDRFAATASSTTSANDGS